MKKKGYLFIFLFAPLITFGQHQLDIRLVDNGSKQFIKNARIKIYENELLAKEEFNNYILILPSKGIFHLEIEANSFEKKIELIAIDQDTVLTFYLNEQIIELSQVIVTAVSKSTELMKVPYVIKPINASELIENSATNLIDGLKNIPGINQITTGNGISKPVIRGLGYNRVITLFNGVRQEGQQWGDEHGIEIDEYVIDRIEIVKGPGSLMYGSDGIAGVINFITPKIPKDSMMHLHFIQNYQTNNQLISNSVYISNTHKNTSWSFRLSPKIGGNYQNKIDGKIYNSGFRELNGDFTLNLSKKWGNTQLNLNSFNTIINIPTGERDSLGNFVIEQNTTSDTTIAVAANKKNLNSYSIGYPHQKINHLRILSTTHVNFPKNRSLLIDVGIQKNLRKEFGSSLTPSISDLAFNLTTTNLNLKFNLKELNNWQSTIGITSMYQNNTIDGLEFIIPEYNQLDAGVFLYTQKSFSRKISIAGGIRYDFRNLMTTSLFVDSTGEVSDEMAKNNILKFNELHKKYSNITGSIGICFQPTTKSTFKWNISRGFRTPSVAELSSNGHHEGALRYEYGNQQLKSEVSHQLDIAYFLRSSHFTIEITPFINAISNYIYVEKLSSFLGGDSVAGTELTPAFQFQQTNAFLLGTEFYSDFHPHPLDWLHIENSFSFVNAYKKKNQDDSHYLPFIPVPKYRLEIKSELKIPLKNITSSYLKVNWDYYWSQNRYYSAYNTETYSKEYALFSIGMGMKFQSKSKNKSIQLFINLDNIFDKVYQNSLSRLKYAPINPATGQQGIYNMGRNLSTKLVFDL